ncbi:MAG: hypothetical protein ACRC5F_03240 [Cetobacterium sp.]
MKPTKDYEVMLFKADRDFESGKILYKNEAFKILEFVKNTLAE